MGARSWFEPLGVVVAIAVIVGISMGAVLLGPVLVPASGPSPSSAAPPPTHYVNLSIVLNATWGVPQYVPANFSVPAGRVVITIRDYDQPGTFVGCGCNVTGTVGAVEMINGTPYHLVPNANVAHTFSSPALNLNILSPGGSTVSFVTELFPGTYPWWCMAPCGLDGMMGFPMGVPGFMAGTITVTN